MVKIGNLTRQGNKAFWCRFGGHLIEIFLLSSKWIKIHAYGIVAMNHYHLFIADAIKGSCTLKEYMSTVA